MFFLSRSLVQTPIGSALVCAMPNKLSGQSLSGQSVDVGASQVVELFTPKADRSADGRDMDAMVSPSPSAEFDHAADGFGTDDVMSLALPL